MVSHYNLSEWEKDIYYHGVSVDIPRLLYRSDYLDKPFPRPVGRFQYTPPKTAHGVFNTPLNPVWHTVAPQIRDMLKVRKIRYSAIHAVRFATHSEDGKESLGPIVIWIATHPASTSADDAHLASLEILEDWAPEISVDVAGLGYTKDLGTFEVDAERFKAQFKGNVVDLGAKYTTGQLIDKFYIRSNGRTVFKSPPNRQLRISGCVPRQFLASPDTFDANGEACMVVMKDGSATDLTIGRCAGLEAYICDELGVESTELAIYNCDRQSGPFSSKGDSGALVFDGQGRMVGILHSGLAMSGSTHVTYATPAWWAVEQLKTQYPHADFDRNSF